MQRSVTFLQESGISGYLHKHVTPRCRSISKNILAILVAFIVSSCATVYMIDDDPEHKLPPLKAGDKVKVYTTDQVKEEFVIDRIDSEYIYGKSDSPKIRKDKIRALEFSGRKPGKNILYVLGIILISFAFGG